MKRMIKASNGVDTFTIDGYRVEIYRDKNCIQITKYAPYDEAEYHWASADLDGDEYTILRNGKKIESKQVFGRVTDISNIKDIIDTLESADMMEGIKPQIDRN